MRFPWVAHDNLLGEPAIEEPGYRIMASLFDGDPQFIFDIILDVGADPSVRFWQWHALTLIALEGKLDRTVAADFARQAVGRLSRDEEESLIWSGWEKVVSRLAVRSHLGLRISNFAPIKPSNVRISTKNILTFDGLASPLELQAGLFRIGVRTLFAPV